MYMVRKFINQRVLNVLVDNRLEGKILFFCYFLFVVFGNTRVFSQTQRSNSLNLAWTATSASGNVLDISGENLIASHELLGDPYAVKDMPKSWHLVLDGETELEEEVDRLVETELVAGDTVYMIVMYGQSNLGNTGRGVNTHSMAGAGFNPNTYSYPGNPNFKNTFLQQYIGFNGTPWTEPAKIYSPVSANYGILGPELAVLHRLTEAHPDLYWAITKVAKGGSNTKNDLKPNADFPNRGFPLITRTIESTQREMNARGKTVQLPGFGLYWQGESDAAWQMAAVEHYDNVKAIIAGLREKVGARDMPFFIMETQAGDPGCKVTYEWLPREHQGKGCLDLVQESQAKIAAEDPNVYLIDPKTFNFKTSDGTHFDLPSVMKAGEVVADEFLALFSPGAGGGTPPNSPNQPPTAEFSFTTNELVVDFDGSTSRDSDGRIVSYEWDFGDGSRGNQANPTHTYPTGGTYSVRLVVKDDDGDSDTFLRDVTVTEPVNQLPTSSFTASPDAGAAPLIVNFDGSASQDPDGNIVSYEWEFGEGSMRNGKVATFTYTIPGTYPVSLTVTDDNGGQDVSIINIRVSPANSPGQPPVASFTATPTTGMAPLPVSFDASGSSDPDGTIVRYAWDFGDGNSGNGVTLNHTYTAPGIYTATLVVTDNDGATHALSEDITVITPSGGGGDCFVEVGSAVVIEAENYTRQQLGSGEFSNRNWTVITEDTASLEKAVQALPDLGGSTRLGLTGPQLEYDIRFTTPGNYYVFIRTKGPNGNGDSFHVGLDGEAVTTDSGYGMGSKVGFWQWANIANTNQVVLVNVSTPGLHTLNLWMREDGVMVDKIILSQDNTLPTGLGSPASSMGDCSGVVNEAPIANIIADPLTGTAPLVVAFQGDNSSDPDGSIASYAWDFGEGNSSNEMNPTHTYTEAGTYTATLTVTDDLGAVGTYSETIVVSPAQDGGDCFVEVGGAVVIEAENYTRQQLGSGEFSNRNWTVIAEDTASLEEAVQALPDLGGSTRLGLTGPQLEYDIRFTTPGNYYVFIRTKGPNGNGDSFHVGLDGEAVTTDSGYGMGSKVGFWQWANIANTNQVVLVNVSTPGLHTLNLWMREDGVMVDKIILSQDNTLPTGLGSPASSMGDCSGVVNEAPIANIIADPLTGTAPLVVAFQGDQSTDPDGNIASYAWDFGDGNSSNEMNPTHTYTEAGTYTAMLTVTDDLGAVGTYSETIVVSPAQDGGGCFVESEGSVVIEAENFSRSQAGEGEFANRNWEVITEGSASTGEAVQALPDLGGSTGLNLTGPMLEYDINFNNTGNYVVFVRTYGPNGQGDSFHIGLDGNSVTNNSGIGMGSVLGSWKWANIANGNQVVVINVTTVGTHTLNLWMREDGIKIDKIILKQAKNVPSGIGPAESETEACVGNNSSPLVEVGSSPKNGEEETQYNVYPIPAQDVLNIEWNSYQGKEVNVQLYTSDMRVIQRHFISSAPEITLLNLTQLSDGLYFLAIRGPEGEIDSKTIMIQR